jgi:hypothetical protein
MNRIDLPITPCEVDWSTMTLADRGRFCGSCGKVVSELAQMTEVEARALLRSPPTEGFCVRYFCDERGEIVFGSDVLLAAAIGGDDDAPKVPTPPHPLEGIPIPHMGVPRPVEPAKRRWPSIPKRQPTPDEDLTPDERSPS